VSDRSQSYANHVRVVPGFHYGVLGVFALNVLWSLVRLWRFPGIESAMALLVAAALLAFLFYARRFALTVQNRVIRLEMRLRLRDLLPEDLRARIGELRVRQLIALRFAPDEELPDLVGQALAEKLSPRAIKERIRVWQADHLRA
jgi:Family of unknown function (DUF6526)